MKKTGSYIGITGLMSAQHVESLLGTLGSMKQLLMIGVLVSLKTLRGQKNKWPKRYPPIEQVAGLFPDHPQTLNLIHYNTSEPESLAGQLTILMAHAGPNCHGVQLNVAWPKYQQLQIFRERYPDKRVVLQCGADTLDNPTHFIQMLDFYIQHGLIDDVLLDPSGGFGRKLDAEELEAYLRAMRKVGYLLNGPMPRFMNTIGYGVAGGLSAKNVNVIAPLIEKYPALSIDAEGRLRDKNDDLDLTESVTYLHCAADIYARLQSAPK